MSPADHPCLTESTRLMLLAVARRWIPRELSGRLDAADVVQSVFLSLWLSRNEAVRSLPTEQLMKVLCYRTRLHAANRVTREYAQGRTPSRESAPDDAGPAAEGAAWQPEDYRELNPAEAAALNELWEWLTARLAPLDERILELRLEGLDRFAIAEQVNVAPRTVNRRLQKVEQLLTTALAPGGASGRMKAEG